MQTTDRYIPALKFRKLTPFYDPLIRTFMGEQAFKKRLIDQAALEPGMRLLDLGCGTGTLAMMIKRLHPQVQVFGLDVDDEILAIARNKVAQAQLDITLDQGMAFELPYAGDHFDRVVSSLVIHHIAKEDKLRSFREIFRVLRKGGEFHMVDFGCPATLYARLTSAVMRNFEDVDDNIRGRIIEYIQLAGFADVVETGHANTFFGTLSYLKAIKPR